jgi:hypothetical protein
MRIHDSDSDKTMKNVMLFLTLSEMKELRDSLQCIINNPSVSNHSHINDESYTHEITVAIYQDGSTDGFDNRAKIIIEKDI